MQGDHRELIQQTAKRFRIEIVNSSNGRIGEGLKSQVHRGQSAVGIKLKHKMILNHIRAID
jgi:hypothetical protein